MEQITGFAQPGQNMTASQEFLTRPEVAGTLNLTAAVRETMFRSSVPSEKLTGYDLHPQIAASVGKAAETQLFLQKEFWHYQLLALQQNQNFDTRELRLLLAQFQDPETWLKFFASNIVDLVLAYDLPYRHGW